MKQLLSSSDSRSAHNTRSPLTATNVSTVATVDDTIATLSIPREVKSELALTPWYHSSVNGRRAMQILEPFANGSFLMRDSYDGRHLFAVTYKSQGRYGNIRIQQARDASFSLNVNDPLQPRFTSPVALLEHVVRVRQATPIVIENSFAVVYLEQPVGRIHEPDSLQAICRKSIRSRLNSDDGIGLLPLPNSLKVSLCRSGANETCRYGIVERKRNE